MSKHQVLITELCEELTPVDRLWRPHWRFLGWSTFSLAIIGTLVVITGDFRSGAFAQLKESWRFVLEIVLGLIGALVAAYYAFQFSIPGTRIDALSKTLSITPFLLFLGLIFYSLIDPSLSPSWNGWRVGCEREVIAFGAIPMLLMIWLAKRAAVIDGKWVGALIGIASMTPAAVAMHLACMYHPWHILVFHVLPVAVIATCGIYIGMRILKL